MLHFRDEAIHIKKLAHDVAGQQLLYMDYGYLI